jgi:hypothetical protein
MTLVALAAASGEPARPAIASWFRSEVVEPNHLGRSLALDPGDNLLVGF